MAVAQEPKKIRTMKIYGDGNLTEAEKLYVWRFERGLCVHCGKPAEDLQTSACDVCTEKEEALNP